MGKIISYFVCFVLLLHSISVAEAQNLRCVYQYRVRYQVDQTHRLVDKMNLDIYDGQTAFYEESVYLKDSLTTIAFDRNGKRQDEKAYQELSRIQTWHQEISFTDLKRRSVTQCYHPGILFITGNGNLDLPDWELQEEYTTIAGFETQKATATYLGRTWEVWFCPEIPVPSGPWLLWGAPGLIVRASDADALFCFELQSLDELQDPSRIDYLKWFFNDREQSKKHYFNLPLPRAESVYYKVRTDYAFYREASGRPGGALYKINSSGEKQDVSHEMQFTPLIPLAHWKER